MPTYVYTARDGNGNASNGTVTSQFRHRGDADPSSRGEVPDPDRAHRRAGRCWVDRAAAALGARGSRSRAPTSFQLSNQLAIMVDTGVTLSEALECVAQQTDKPKVRALLDDVLRVVHSGTDLSTALARHEASFPRLYVALIRASEKSGMMGKLLARATHYLRDEQDTMRRVKEPWSTRRSCSASR
jgi:type II secretory pathway component PulF